MSLQSLIEDAVVATRFDKRCSEVPNVLLLLTTALDFKVEEFSPRKFRVLLKLAKFKSCCCCRVREEVILSGIKF